MAEPLSEKTSLVAVVELSGVVHRLRQASNVARVAYLLNREGVLLAHSSGDALVGEPIGRNPAALMFQQGRGTTPGVVSYPAQRGTGAVERIAVYTPVPDSPHIATVLEVDSASLYFSINSFRQETYRWWAVLLLAVVSVALFTFPVFRKRYPRAAWGLVVFAVPTGIVSALLLRSPSPELPGTSEGSLESEEKAAMILGRDGAVQVRSFGERVWAPAAEGTQLSVLDVVRTLEGSTVTLQLANGEKRLLTPLSVFRAGAR